MDLDFSAEQTQLRDMVRALCAAHVDARKLRALEQDARGFDPALWQAIGELGLAGVLVDEAHGGVGLGLLDCVIIHEELGGCVAPTPHFASCVQSATLLALAGDEAQRRQWLPAIASGAKILVTAWREPGMSADAAGVGLRVQRRDGRLLLDGVKTLLPFARAADAFLVLARLDGELALLLVPASASGLRLEELPNHAGQALCALHLQGVVLDGSALLAGGCAAAAWHGQMCRSLVVLAAESVGGAVRMLAMATDYAKQRVQFGQPIASFQAIAHYLADMATEVEAARYLVYQAAWAADCGRDFEQLALMARQQAGAVYRRVSSKGVQIHGGLGFSLDADPQLYYRRAKHQQLMHWDPAFLERRIAAGVFGA
jgi:alkylation response protein AidB-like acyl-CoA dehydrogenase